MSSIKERRVLARTEHALRRSDADLGALLDEFTARCAGQAMPHIESRARRALLRPLAVLVVAASIAIIVTMGYAIARAVPCSRPPPSSTTLVPPVAMRGLDAKLVRLPACQASARVPAQPGANR